jgi:hypothetical protein
MAETRKGEKMRRMGRMGSKTINPSMSPSLDPIYCDCRTTSAVVFSEGTAYHPLEKG